MSSGAVTCAAWACPASTTSSLEGRLRVQRCDHGLLSWSAAITEKEHGRDVQVRCGTRVDRQMRG